jgi:DNA-binding GntR family transcriptional regulator
MRHPKFISGGIPVEFKGARGNQESKNKLHYQTKQQMAYEIIRSNILDGTYKPQQHLVVSKLIEEIGISTIPIREALKQLEAEGLVKSFQHKGVQVVLYSPEEFEHLYMIRVLLEGLAGRLGTENITAADINRMKMLLGQMGLALEKGDLEERNQLHFEFHQILYQAAHCQQLNKIITNLWDNTHYNVYCLANRFIPGFFEQDQKGHDAIIDAVIAREPELVERLIKDSINNSGKVMTEYLKSPDDFTG